MRDNIALQRYLQRHIEHGLPHYEGSDAAWRQVLVLPAYREPAALLHQLQALPAGRGRSLLILVLNRPDSDTDEQANSELREAIGQRTRLCKQHRLPLVQLNNHTDLYLFEADFLAAETGDQI